ncbi:hypothetical protein [Bacteroides sp.]|uniref:hypothetical protein n=1 Tax=Bacteroides sp. TaxID=29523 RepID=UPI002A81DE1D|nr:hypothetical protein [Bacteroides sp.]
MYTSDEEMNYKPKVCECYEDETSLSDELPEYQLYREKLHGRKDWKRQDYWLRTRSNPYRRCKPP